MYNIGGSKQKEEIPVTVCIAALCENNMIIGAADRMITTEDVQFEPPTPKIIPITPSIIAMTAGNYPLHSEILQDVRSQVDARIKKEPKNWWDIRDVADLYAKFYHSVKLNRAELAILAPFGLNRDTFIARQQQMSESFVTAISNDMLHFQTPYIYTIIAGVDTTGAHIYVVINGEINCWDTVGFASIGAGSRHAESQFQFAGHTPYLPIADTLLLTYTAKRRAEVAPGVGKGTDMFIIGPGLDRSDIIREEIVTNLGAIYRKNIERGSEIQNEALQEARCYVKKIQQATVEAKQQSEDTQKANGEQTSNGG